MINVQKYLVIQLKTFKYDQDTHEFSKIVPKILIDDEIHNILLKTLKLKAIVYHSGNSPFGGHYKSSVRYNNTWYVTNDGNPNSVLNSDDVPYLIIYEKDNDVQDNNIVSESPLHEVTDIEHTFDVNNVNDVFHMSDESDPANIAHVNEPKSSSLDSGTAKTSVYKGYVIWPNEDCNERFVINSDEEIIDCKNCGTMSNITFLELFQSPMITVITCDNILFLRLTSLQELK